MTSEEKTFMQYGLKWVAETSAAPEVSFAQTAICDFLGVGGGGCVFWTQLLVDICGTAVFGT